MKKLWFKAKKFGWGWTPTSWEGWFLTILFTAIIIFCLAVLASLEIWWVMVCGIALVVISILFTSICIAKGEKPRWKWGE